MATWPATLPQHPLKAGYSRSPRAVLIRSQMESGPVKVRRRTTAGVGKLQASYRFTTAQVAIFESWFAGTIGYGVERFDLPNPEAGGIFVCRFAGGDQELPYTITEAGPDRWIMTTNLEVMP